MSMQEILINFQDVTVGYGTTPVLEHVNLEIRQYEWFLLLGRNGCGKSSLIKTILGILAPLAGQITRQDAILGQQNQFIGYVPQEHSISLPPLMSAATLLLNSLDPLNTYHYSDATKHQLMLNLTDKLGLDPSLLHPPFRHLSGGQKKLIHLAQALINTPKLLLLDEPLVNLDITAIKLFLRALVKVSPELTVIMVSHDHRFSPKLFPTFIHIHDRVLHHCAPRHFPKRHYGC